MESDTNDKSDAVEKVQSVPDKAGDPTPVGVPATSPDESGGSCAPTRGLQFCPRCGLAGGGQFCGRCGHRFCVSCGDG